MSPRIMVETEGVLPDPLPCFSTKSSPCNKATHRPNIFGQIQIPALPGAFKTSFRRSSRRLGATICIPLAATCTPASADADVTRGHTPSPDRNSGASVSMTYGDRVGGSSNSSGSDTCGKLALGQCTPAPKPHRFSVPTPPKIARPRRLAQRPESAGRYVKVVQESARPLTPTRSPSHAAGVRSHSCTSRSANSAAQDTARQQSVCSPKNADAKRSSRDDNLPSSVSLDEVDSFHGSLGAGPQCHSKSEPDVDGAVDAVYSNMALDEATLQQPAVFASHACVKRSSASSGLSSSAIPSEAECLEGRPCYMSQRSRKNKPEQDSAMAAKYLSSVLHSAVLKQPACFSSTASKIWSSGSRASSSSGTLSETECLEGRPGYKPPRNPDRKIELDDSIFELWLDFGPSSDDSTKTCQPKGQGARSHAPFDSRIDL